MAFGDGNDYRRPCLDGAVPFGAALYFICVEPSWDQSQDEFRVVDLEGVGDVVHYGIQDDAVKDEFGLMGLSIDSLDFHAIAQNLF